MRDTPYSDLDRPPLSAVGLRRGLIVPGGLWMALDLRASTGSTNADAVRAARSGAPEGHVVVAEQQTAGRGRLGRSWASPPRAGLAVSVLLRPGEASIERGWSPVPPGAYGWLPLLAGVALVEAVTQRAEIAASLKWPNDLLVGDAKCGGILAEAVPGNGTPGAVVIGVGLNVTLRADELPPPGSGVPATSLRLAGARVTDRDPLLRALLRSLANWYERWRDSGADASACGLRSAYVESCATLGRPVRVLLPGGDEITGTATTVDDDGRLVVGDRGAVAAGDVVHVR